jgi:hypothetical protein
VTTFEPTSRGIDADQLVVPLAVPDCPVFVDHMTDVTPTLSLAVPLNAIVADDVETEVAPGDAIVNEGGVVFPPDEGAVDAATRVTVTTRDTQPDPADAVTVIVFAPIASATFEIVHAAALPVAVPEIAVEDDPVDQVTVIAPDPPEAAPVRLTVAAVVVAAVAFTVSVNGAAAGEAGAGAGAGAAATAPGCAA